MLQLFVSFILHIDQHLLELFNLYGLWIYGILFVIIFSETGLVVTPLLPGDSLLFATGALIAGTSLNVHTMALTLISAAILGNVVNYTIGRYFGTRLFRNPDSRWFRRDYLLRAEQFFAKYGGRAVVLTRFAPIIRTFVPFAAGMGGMNYPRFLAYNVAGGVAWVSLFLYAGYFFGNLPQVRENFTLLILGIVVLSLVPVAVEWWRARK